MIYILGGAPRSGKTLLARRAVVEKQIPYFPTDALVSGLMAIPQLGINYDQPFIERSVTMWPITRSLLNCLLEEERDYLVEGDSLLPSQMTELQTEGKAIKSCFIGYSNLKSEQKLALVRDHHQGEIDWTKEMPDEKLLPMIDRMIQFSRYLEEESVRVGIKYFDISDDFHGPRQDAFTYLFA